MTYGHLPVYCISVYTVSEKKLPVCDKVTKEKILVRREALRIHWNGEEGIRFRCNVYYIIGAIMKIIAVVILVLFLNYIIKVILFRDLTVKKLKELLDRDATIIDVRTEGEYRVAHQSKALSIPLNQLNDRISEAVPDRGSTILLYCRSGARSFVAKRILANMQYRNVYNIGPFSRAKKIVSNV
jgi:phage shock protein E